MDAELRTPKHRTSEYSDDAWLPLSSWSHEGSIEDVCDRDGVVVEKGFAMDCGGSRVKIVCFQRGFLDELPGYVLVEEGPAVPVREEGRDGVLKFVTLPTKKLPQFIEYCREMDLMSEYCPQDGVREVIATGGGAWKFAPDMLHALNIKITALPEMQTLVDGLDFILSHCGNVNEVFEYDLTTKAKLFVNEPISYPYMIVSIGSGVSIIKVNGPGDWQRVSGSCIGGGTYWGLSKLLTNVKTWDELEHLRQVENTVGDNKEVDLLVGDIYGGRGLSVLGLKSEVIASSFGKCGVVGETTEHDGDMLGRGGDVSAMPPQKKYRKTRASRNPNAAKKTEFAAADLHRSLLLMIANNIGQIAYLNAKLHKTDKIYFTGGFTHNNPYIWSKLTYAIRFWSQHSIEPRFLSHDGYLGALGALLHGVKRE